MTPYQKRFYKISGIYFAFILSFIMGVTACSTLGYENVDTTRKAIVVANAEIRAANLLLQDLIGRRAIGREPATRALNDLRTAHNHLQTALSAIDAAGDPVLANTSLNRARLSLSIALNLLAPLVGDEQ